VVADLEALADRERTQLLEPLAVAAQHVGVGVDGAAEAAQVVADGRRLLVSSARTIAEGVGGLAGEDLLRQGGGALEGVDGELHLGGEATHGVAVGVDLSGLEPVVAAADRVTEPEPVLLGLDAVDHDPRHGVTRSS
jgi:hypothetical protein